MKKCSLKTLSTVEDWQIEKMKHKVETLPVNIYIESDDPDGMKGIDQVKSSKAAQARFKIIKPFRDAMDNKYQWCIAAIPGAAWARWPVGRACEGQPCPIFPVSRRRLYPVLRNPSTYLR